MDDEQTAKILIRLYRKRRLEEFTETSEVFYRDILKPRLAPNILATVNEHRYQGHSEDCGKTELADSGL